MSEVKQNWKPYEPLKNQKNPNTYLRNDLVTLRTFRTLGTLGTLMTLKKKKLFTLRSHKNILTTHKESWGILESLKEHFNNP